MKETQIRTYEGIKADRLYKVLPLSDGSYHCDEDGYVKGSFILPSRFVVVFYGWTDEVMRIEIHDSQYDRRDIRKKLEEVA